MRQDALGLLKQIEKDGLAYIFYRSKPKAIMINIEEFTRIQQLLEDYLDEKEAKNLSRQPKSKGIPLEKIAKKFRNISIVNLIMESPSLLDPKKFDKNLLKWLNMAESILV